MAEAGRKRPRKGGAPAREAARGARFLGFGPGRQGPLPGNRHLKPWNSPHHFMGPCPGSVPPFWLCLGLSKPTASLWQAPSATETDFPTARDG